MTQQEFTNSMGLLIRVYGDKTFPEERTKLIWERVKDLDANWLRKVVERIILANDPRFNFDEASRAERLAKTQVRLADDAIRASEAVNAQMTERGYQEALAKFNANSLLEAVFRKGRV